MTSVEPDLALDAREVLARTGGGTLHIHGIGTLGPDGADVLFYDDDGRPTFLAPPNSPVAVAATRRRAAALSIPAGSTEDGVTTLLLAGHLATVGHEDIDGERVDVVGLLVHSVVLEHDRAESPAVVQQAIPLADWTTARPDPIRRTAQRILRHTNDSHAAQLRRFVAELRAVPESDIAAAELFELEATGVDVRWLDARGAHSVRVRFPEPATCPGSLAGRLREILSGHAH